MRLVIKAAAPAILLILSGLQGCATIMNGTRQPVEVKADGAGFEVSLDDGPARKTPVILNLTRNQDHVLTLKSLETGDSSRIEVERKTSLWMWGNFCTGLYGLIGVVVDYKSGGMFLLRIRPGIPDENSSPEGIPYGLEMSWDVDPWRTGDWHGSFAYNPGLRIIPRDSALRTAGSTEPEVGFNLVLGKNDWPVDLVLDGFFYSSAVAIGNWEIARAGLRKSLYKDFARARPYFSAGLSLLAESTQRGGGLPLGFWGRAGVDIRTGHRFFLGPYVGYSKYEMTTSGVNTGGAMGGVLLGILW